MPHGNRELRDWPSVFEQHQKDVPFALVYLVDARRRTARLAGATRVEMGGPWCPLAVALHNHCEEPWPIAKVWATKRAELVERAFDGYGGLPRLPPGAPLRALVVPIEPRSPHGFAGVLVMGVSPSLQDDAGHRDFVELVTTELARAITTTLACEERLPQTRRYFGPTDAFAASETKYRSLFEAIDAGFCIVEALFDDDRAVDCRFLELNPAFQKQTGIEIAAGRTTRDIALDDHTVRWLRACADVALTGRPVRFHTSSKVLARELDVHAFRIGGPEERQVAILVNDITPRRRAEEALRESEALKAFLLKLSDAIRSLSDAEEIQKTVTHTVMHHFGADRCYYCEIEGDRAIIRRDAALGNLPSVTGVYPLGNFRLFRAAIDAGQPLVVSDTSVSEFLDEDLRQLLGQLKISSFLAVPVIKDGEPVGILSITQCTRREWTAFDVRVALETAERTWAAVERGRAEVALRESEARLRESAKRKDEFLAMLGHELRNPLAAIRSSAEVMKLTATNDSRLQRIQRVLDRQSTHMSRLIDGLLEITRIVRGKVQLVRETCDAREIAAGVLLDRRSQWRIRGLELTEDLPSEPVWIHADGVRVAQILDNLIGNAIKFTQTGGKIDLRLREQGGWAVMRVRDTGIGISPDAIARLFEPFQQGNQESHRSGGGLGLGLALAKRLVELHGGNIEAFSDGPGKGAEFQVRLPLAAGPPGKRQPEPAVQVVGCRILVVEDNTDVGQSLRDLLELLGHEVDLVPTGYEALAVLRRQKPDVVFCDLGLPGMSGFEVARAIRSSVSLADMQLVAVSGYGQPEDRKKTQKAGFDAHLVKPVDVQKVNEALRSLAPRSPSALTDLANDGAYNGQPESRGNMEVGQS